MQWLKDLFKVRENPVTLEEIVVTEEASLLPNVQTVDKQKVIATYQGMKIIKVYENNCEYVRFKTENGQSFRITKKEANENIIIKH